MTTSRAKVSKLTRRNQRKKARLGNGVCKTPPKHQNQPDKEESRRIVAAIDSLPLPTHEQEERAKTSTKKRRKRFYVGKPHGLAAILNGEFEVFRSVSTPTQEEYPQYSAVIGPFRTKAGADYMCSNPSCESVAEAEWLAKLEKEGAKNNASA